MPRNAEVIRQWEVLRAVEASRIGETIHSLAGKTGVSTRTIRRDLEALQQAGFPLFDERNGATTRWRLNARPFRALEATGLTIAETAALYFSRTLVECLAGTPFQDDLRSAFAKLDAVLTPAMRRFLDRLPSVILVKPDPIRKRDAPAQRAAIARLLEATLHQRRVRMQYYSFSSGRQKEYVIEPLRLIYAQGGLYLSAYVPEYQERRTFAVERIRSLSLLEETFEVAEGMAAEAFVHSLGVSSGPPEHVEIAFAPAVVPYVTEREWHPSQALRHNPDGSVVLALDVADDAALRAWILSFGPYARVLSPSRLAERILDELEEARIQYRPRLAFD
jgi:predicted DNA-binding transcriptional regulator YafY